MLMAALVGLGFALLVAFLARAMLPAPWNRYVFMALGLPALGLVIAGLGVTIYYYGKCQESLLAEHLAQDGRVAMAIKMVDCGSAPDRTYDVSVALIEGEKVTTRTILRSRGRPVPTEVAMTGPNSFTVTLDDGTTRTSTLEGPAALPAPVWSLIDGVELH
ncbi:hypothetical protein D3874_26270 [Oleomonas cavernae]|uniref:Uncharacterized protein n=2 Tax=Oleomonas cavernae TaxID=2320859 RepID=A0A418VTZ1_9PROT|nr:hypothetical protein D3874_26270 [Oleomonas cavernae]